jgi:hypothetical protein
MMRLRLPMLTPASASSSWNRRISSELAVSGERSRNAAMSSIKRRRKGLIEPVVMANASLVEVDTSIFRKAFSGLLR